MEPSEGWGDAIEEAVNKKAEDEDGKNHDEDVIPNKNDAKETDSTSNKNMKKCYLCFIPH